MLPVILGAIALGTVGYKCVKEGSIKDGVVSSIEETLEAVCKGLDEIEDTFNLNSYEYTSEVSTPDKEKTLDINVIKKRFKKLHQKKLKISQEINSLEIPSLKKIRVKKTKLRIYLLQMKL